jgi:hypothetical protein
MTTSTTLTIPEIFVNEFQFFAPDRVQILGFYRTESEYKKTVFVCSLIVLSQLLHKNGKLGSELIYRIREEQTCPHEMPHCIDIVEGYGMTQELKIEGFVITDYGKSCFIDTKK